MTTPGPPLTRVVASPRLRALESEVALRGETALDSFWADVAEQGSPLVEPAPDTDQRLVTVLWRETEPLTGVYVLANRLTDKNRAAYGLMHRLDQLDIPSAIAAGVSASRFPPTAVVGVESGDAANRTAQLGANPEPLTMLADELIPSVATRRAGPGRTVLCGQSLGGVTALTAVRRDAADLRRRPRPTVLGGGSHRRAFPSAHPSTTPFEER